MSVHLAGSGGGGAGIVSGVAGRVLYTSDGVAYNVDDDFRFDGDTVGIGGAQRSGYKLRILANSGDFGMAVEPNAAGSDIGLSAVAARNFSTYLQQIVYGPLGGSTAGRANNSLIQLLGVNSAGILIGSSDQQNWSRAGANAAAAIGGTLDSFFTAVGNVGAGPDILQTYSIPAGVMSRDGARINFGFETPFAANANPKGPALNLAGSPIWTPTAAAQSGGALIGDGWIKRLGATSAIACVRGFVVPSGGTPISVGLISRVAVTPTWSGAVVLDLIAATCTADNDIQGRLWVDLSEAGN